MERQLVFVIIATADAIATNRCHGVNCANDGWFSEDFFYLFQITLCNVLPTWKKKKKEKRLEIINRNNDFY